MCFQSRTALNLYKLTIKDNHTLDIIIMFFCLKKNCHDEAVVFVAGAGGSSLEISTVKRSVGLPTDGGPKEIVPYVPLLRKEGFNVVVEWIICNRKAWL